MGDCPGGQRACKTLLFVKDIILKTEKQSLFQWTENQMSMAEKETG